MAAIPQPAPVPDSVWAFLNLARKLLDYLALLTPVQMGPTTLGKSPIAVYGEELPDFEALIEELAAEAAVNLEYARRGLRFHPDAWGPDPLLGMVMPGYLGFFPAFVKLLLRWGFSPNLGDLDEEGVRYELAGPESLARPLAAHPWELVALERAYVAMKRVSLDPFRSTGATFVLTDEGVYRAENQGPSVAVDFDPPSVRIGDAMYPVTDTEAAFVKAILDSGDRPIAFPEMEARDIRLKGGNQTRIKGGLPNEVRGLIESVTGYRLRR